MRERVKVPPSKVVIDYVMRPQLEADSRDSFEPLMDLSRAHVVMLAARGIVPRVKASELMRVFEDVCREGTDAISWDPALEDAYYNLETHIIKKAGPDVGGQMHTEWWIPAEDLEAMNDNIVGTIEVIHEFRK